MAQFQTRSSLNIQQQQQQQFWSTQTHLQVPPTQGQPQQRALTPQRSTQALFSLDGPRSVTPVRERGPAHPLHHSNSQPSWVQPPLPPQTQLLPTPQPQIQSPMVPLVSYIELPQGDRSAVLQRAPSCDAERMPSLLATSHSDMAASRSQSCLAPAGHNTSRSQSCVAPAGAHAERMQERIAGAHVQAIPVAHQVMPFTLCAAGANVPMTISGLPVTQSYTPALQGSYVAPVGSYVAPPTPMQSVRQGSYIAPVGSYVAPPAPMQNSYCTPQSSSRASAQAVPVAQLTHMQGSHSQHSIIIEQSHTAQPRLSAQPIPVAQPLTPLGGPATILLSAARPLTAQPALSAGQLPPVAQSAPAQSLSAAQPLAADAGRYGTPMHSTRTPMQDSAGVLPCAQVMNAQTPMTVTASQWQFGTQNGKSTSSIPVRDAVAANLQRQLQLLHSNCDAAAESARKSQQPASAQQAWPTYQTIQQPVVQQHWPQNMSAKQALFRSQSSQSSFQASASQPILQQSAPHSDQQHTARQPILEAAHMVQQTLISTEHAVIACQMGASSAYQQQPEPVVDALTLTQEIYSPQASPEVEAREVPTPICDNISFFGAEELRSVVIQGGSVAPASQGVVSEAASVQGTAVLVAAGSTEKEITQRLVDAAEDGNLEALCEAIRRAMLANLSSDLIDWARTRREVLEEENWSLKIYRASSQALEEAIRGGSTEILKSALERAESIGVIGSLLEQARDELSRRRGRQDAEAGLYAALGQTPCDGLADAIERATAAGVGTELVSHARRRLTEVQEFNCSLEASSVAEQKLRDLVRSCDDVSSLTSAIEAAQNAGASLTVVDSARAKKADLQEQAWQSQSRDLAYRRSDIAYPTSNPASGIQSGVCTPASTVGHVGSDVREELAKLMRMPTQSLERMATQSLEENSTSPIHMASEDVTGPVDSLTCLNASHTVREPASEPTNLEERALQHTPTTAAAGQADAFGEISNVMTSVCAEDQPAQAPRSSWRPSVMQEELPIYGLDAELKAKADAKYDLSAEDQAAQWVQDITDVQVVGVFGEALRTGQVLCQLLNAIKPGTIAKINNAGMPFKERENICKFLKVCRTWGVHEYALFSTDDLYDEKNLMSVVKCLYQLGGVLRKAVPDFQGPSLGVADMSSAKRDQRRSFQPCSQTGGLQSVMQRSNVDMLSTGNVRTSARGGC